MGERLTFGAPTVGPRRRRVEPQPRPPAPVSLSASERSHRHRLVVEAQRAITDHPDDGVARLIARRKAAVALEDRVHVDTTPTRAAAQIARLVRARGRATSAVVAAAPAETPHSPADDVARLLARRAATPNPDAPAVASDVAVTRLLSRRSSEV